MEIRMALTGFGNVGQGLASILIDRGEEYRRRYGVDLRLTGVADRQGAAVDPAGLDPASLLDWKRREGTVSRGPNGTKGLGGEAFLDAAKAQVLMEAASTNYETAEPSWTYVTAALDRDMDVVLASKGVLALRFRELMDEAGRRGRDVLFSATVAAPLPTLQVAERALAGTEIKGFEAILNGTTNQILTAMAGGAGYDEGVRQAQALGIAETDPTLDVDGWDAAAKTTILANAVLGASLQISDITREGIRGVSRGDLEAARQNGETIKLICRATRSGRATVGPETRGLNDVLGRLRGDQMGLVFDTVPLGGIALTTEGEGTGGGISTAMTMLRDVFNLARDRRWMTPGV